MANNLPISKKATVISMLAEGASMCAVSRMTGIHGDTIGRLALRVGNACKTIMDTKMKNLNCQRIQCDEAWGYIAKKAKHTTARERAMGMGDVWVFVSLDEESKLVPSFLVGRRDMYHARAFMDDLAGRMANRITISTDALASYPDAIERAFGSEISYGQIVKTYSLSVPGNAPANVRYSPAEVVKVEKTIVCGMPEIERISTSLIEKQNHTLRMHCRRMSRLTNAFSKKRENFEAAIALHYCYYNFIKSHKAIRMTPAQAARVEASAWTVAELVERCGE